MAIENKYKVEDWDIYYEGEKKFHIPPKRGFFISYDIYLCDKILERYLPKDLNDSKEKLKICEIGCGDGKLVSKLTHRFNYEPFGIEYSKIASAQARDLGVKVIEGNVFDDSIIAKYKNYFDIVYSYGFIEHINPPEPAIDVHLKLLKPGGTFFIQIPRFKGFNYWRVKIFRPELLSFHNLDIMEAEKLQPLLDKPNIEKLFCSNYGTFKLRLPMAQKNIKYWLLKTLCLIEYPLNPLLRLFFKERGFETKFFSPAVIFIGKKLF